MTIAQQLEKKGREKGRREGKYEASLEIARRMLENGLDNVSIMKITGLTEEELKHIHH